jgi:hypothetical protein
VARERFRQGFGKSSVNKTVSFGKNCHCSIKRDFFKPAKRKNLIIDVRLGYREISGRASEEKDLYHDQRCRAGP